MPKAIDCCNGTHLNTASGFIRSYAYDNLDRLQTFSDTGGVPRAYSYDAFGNVALSSASGLTVDTTTSALSASRSTAASLGSGNRLLTVAHYDHNGNQLDEPGTGGCSNCLRYDAENRLVRFAATNTSFVYDADGHRVQTLNGSNGISTTYVYDALGHVAAEYTSASQKAPCAICYISTDHLGSTRMVTDQGGNLIARHDYLPFGEEIYAGSAARTSLGTWGAADTISRKFIGKERDPESQLDYFGARYYGAALGRWTSPDWSEAPQPIPYADLGNPQSLNLYNYVLNNPVTAGDLDGHDGCKDNPQLCRDIRDAVHGGGSIQDGKDANASRQATIGPLPKTPGTQVGERVMGALKGAASDALKLGSALTGNASDSVAQRWISALEPQTQDERFGAEVSNLGG